jgi:uncharacterized protein
MRTTHILPAVLLALLLAAGGSAFAADPLALYQGRAVVTGTGEENRSAGFAAALSDVLAKVSGDARLIGDPRVAELDAPPLVASFAYRDRMEGIPFHDEQGSRDRPHDLTVTFDRAKIDAALRSLGREPWIAPRPTIVLFLRVANSARDFMLAADGEFGIDMREALEAASSLVGIELKVPRRAQFATSGISAATLADTDPSALDAATKALGGDQALAGSLVWSDEALGWIAEWRLDVENLSYRWDIRGVSFDAAFRNGLRGAAQALSGNGAPQ